MDDVDAAFWVKLAIGVLVSAFLGGGAVTRLLLRGLREELRETFVTAEALEAVRQDLKAAGDRTEGVKSVALGARDSADGLRDEVRALQQDHANQVQRFGEVVVEPLKQVVSRLDDIAARQASQGEALAAHSEALKGLGHSVDQLRADVHRLQGIR